MDLVITEREHNASPFPFLVAGIEPEIIKFSYTKGRLYNG